MNHIQIQHIRPAPRQIRPNRPERSAGGPGSFQEVLNSTLSKKEGVSFSLHAAERLKSRNIAIGQEDVNRITQAVIKAENKGSRDALVLMDGLAFVVNVKNKIVVTAMTGEQMRDKVITNIDSTILA